MQLIDPLTLFQLDQNFDNVQIIESCDDEEESSSCESDQDVEITLYDDEEYEFPSQVSIK